MPRLYWFIFLDSSDDRMLCNTITNNKEKKNKELCVYVRERENSNKGMIGGGA